jgi:hypothetical protein
MALPINPQTTNARNKDTIKATLEEVMHKEDLQNGMCSATPPK